MFDNILVIAAVAMSVVCTAFFGIAALNQDLEGMLFWGMLAFVNHTTASKAMR